MIPNTELRRVFIQWFHLFSSNVSRFFFLRLLQYLVTVFGDNVCIQLSNCICCCCLFVLVRLGLENWKKNVSDKYIGDKYKRERAQLDSQKPNESKFCFLKYLPLSQWIGKNQAKRCNNKFTWFGLFVF